MSDLEITGIRPDEKETLIRLLVAAFPDDPAETWARVVERLWGDFEHTRVGRIDGEIVSTVQIFRYQMRLDDAIFKAGAIAHVATWPHIKGATYAGRLLRDAVDVMKREGMTLTILVTDIPRYYNRYGWWLVHERGWRIEIGDADTATESPYEIEPLDIAKHYEAVAAIHEASSVCFNGTTPRSRDMWLTESPWEPDDPKRSLVATKNGEVVGYVRARAGSLRIVGELCSRETGASVALLDRLIEVARVGGERALHGKFPLDAAVADALRAQGHRVEEEFPCGPDEDFEITMVGFLDLPGFFKEFQPQLQARVERAGYAGDCNVALSCRAGVLGISSRGGVISTSAEPPDDAERVKIKDEALVQFICGGLDSAGLTLPEGVSDEAARLLHALNAQRDFVLWLPDHF